MKQVAAHWDRTENLPIRLNFHFIMEKIKNLEDGILLLYSLMKNWTQFIRNTSENRVQTFQNIPRNFYVLGYSTLIPGKIGKCHNRTITKLPYGSKQLPPMAQLSSP